MDSLPTTINKQLQGAWLYSTKMAALWAQLASANIKQWKHTTQSLFDFIETQNTLYLDIPALLPSLAEYLVDSLQRHILFVDILRKRGNHYLEHVAAGQPPVLIFSYHLLMDGRKLEKPVNYGLVEIIPPKEIPIDPTKRPYIIIDPRAGHGSGISGFKDESQVGFALRAGHPVYVVIFFPDPEPQQTLADVAAAQERFLRAVAKRHPHSPKPCVIGNCQGGWAVLTLAAAHPDIAGVIVVNGAPLAYWAGENGKNPMRYAGGILGGSWLAQLAGDLGNGKFDGANLVMNFEFANPANTYWEKYYHLFANIDSEEKRFLEFERWWGGFSLMNVKEMRSIVENLFIGNKLVHGKIPLGQSSQNLDLRDISVPIIIFCSQGDNITPPEQALRWIAELYSNTLEIKLNGQVIVYLIHENIGHLGIFVSSSVAKKEHKQIIDVLNYVENLPPGLYEMNLQEVKNSGDEQPNYTALLAERTIEDITPDKTAVHNDEDIFNLVHLVSDYNAMSYDFFIGPIIRMTTNDYTAKLLTQCHPLRASRYLISDINPYFCYLKYLAPLIQHKRHVIDKHNAFFALQEQASSVITELWNTYRMHRDSGIELLFYATYRLLYAWSPLDSSQNTFMHDTHDDHDAALAQHIIASADRGSTAEAVIRILLLLVKTQGFIRGANVANTITILRNSNVFQSLTDDDLRQITHTQTIIVEYNSALALETLPNLLKSQEERTLAINTIRAIYSTANMPPSEKIQEKIRQIQQVLNGKNG
ncbi:MAG: hypothetical protein A3E83_08875 [Gammaproteobacteria bacterium RIFCSPHIGHO2_12_FULL_41_20]|nr:MAG: hypothetical protein A3E83_08875 [Gammaproteobacteria bacterium RIFCSPHIGHO2_12_FULL_41_20]